MSIEWVVSEGDVKKHPKYGTLSLEEILFSYGMDVKQGFDVDKRNESEVEETKEEHFGFTHRSVFTGEIHTCPRYIGVARTDGKWRRFTENFVAA